MELKTKYQYTYFVHPYIIDETKYEKYILKLLKDKKCSFKVFEKELLNLADFVMKHEKAMYHIYYSVSRDKLEDYLYDGSVDTITQIIKKKSIGTDCNEEDIEIVSIFCTNAFTSSVLRWIKDGMKSDLGHILKRITLMFDDALRVALIKAGQNK